MDYDSDSSMGDDASYTETSTLLGYPSKEPTDDTISHLGGIPTWIDEKTAPSAALAKCKVCNDLMVLLLELNGDMPNKFPGHERRLYIFSCRRKTCRRKEGSIRSIRGSRVSKVQSTPSKNQESKEKIEEAPKVDIGATLFGGSSQGKAPAANPFSTGAPSMPNNPFSASTSTPSANPFSSASALAAKPPQTSTATPSSTLPETFASKLQISSSDSTAAPSSAPALPHEPWPSQDKFPPPYPHNHLDAEYETLSAPSTPQVGKVKIDAGEGSSSGGGGGGEDKELFESTMDKAFQKFADRVDANNEQVLRYEFNGAPLLYSDRDAIGKLLAPKGGHGGHITTALAADGNTIPRCTNCGQGRVFEVQLTPHAIAVLEEEEMGIDGMEWGTIIVGVCSKDCSAKDVGVGEVGYLEEFVGVQWEELEEKRR